MRDVIALALLTVAVVVGGGACCFLAIAIKRTIVLRYWEWRLDRAIAKEYRRLPMRLVK